MWYLYLLIFLSGFVDAIAGGGGLISVSAYFAAGLPPHLALGTNKFSAFLGTGIASMRFIRNGHVHWLSAVCAFFGALGGSAGGALLALLVDERILTYLILALVPLVMVFIIVKRDFGIQEKQLAPGRIAVYSVLVGVVVGAYDGFFGPGAGTFLIIAFTSVLGFGLMTACGNAKIVNFASNIAAMATFSLGGNVDLRLGIPCAACGILGSYIGAGLAMRKGAKIVRPMMIVVIILLLVKILWDLYGGVR